MLPLARGAGVSHNKRGGNRESRNRANDGPNVRKGET